MTQHKEFLINSLKSIFLWYVSFGRDAVYFKLTASKNIDEIIKRQEYIHVSIPKSGPCKTIQCTVVKKKWSMH